jgi:hypothetical protein
LIGVAVYVTDVPWQMGFAEAYMETPTGRFWITVIVIILERTGFPFVQDSPEVSLQERISPFVGVNRQVGLLEPIFMPLACH